MSSLKLVAEMPFWSQSLLQITGGAAVLTGCLMLINRGFEMALLKKVLPRRRGAADRSGTAGPIPAAPIPAVLLAIHSSPADAGLPEREVYRFLLENTSDLIFQIGLRQPLPLHLPLDQAVDWIFREAYIIAVNDEFVRAYGYIHASELVGQPLTRVVPHTPENEAMERELVTNGHRIVDARTEELDRQGNRKVMLNSIIGRIEAGYVYDYIGTARDITQQVLTEEALAAQQQRYRSIFEAAGVALWEADFAAVKTALDQLQQSGVKDFRQYFTDHPDFIQWAIDAVRLLDVNEMTLHLFDVADKAQFLTAFRLLVLPEILPAFTKILLTLAENKPFLQSETVLQTFKRERRYVLFTITFPATADCYNRILITWVDITDRKRRELNEQFFAQLDLRLRQLTDADAMIGQVLRDLGHYLNVDRATWFKLNEASRQATIEQDWRRNQRPGHTGSFAIASLLSPELEAAHKAGEPVAIADVATGAATVNQVSTYLQLGIAALINIPYRHEDEWVAALHVSTEAPRIWRSDEVALLQETVARIWPLIEQVRAETALRESEERLRLALIAADQGLYDLNVQTGAAIVSPEYASMLGYDPKTFEESNAAWRERLHPDDWESVSRTYEQYVTGQLSEYRVEFRQRTASGQWKWILSLGKIVSWDSEGNPLRMLGTHTDISYRKQAEQEREQLLAQEQVARKAAEQMNRLKDDFFSALSHELRTPLNPILGWTQLLRMQRLNSDQIQQALDAIERNARQQISIVDDLLDMSRVIQGKMQLDFRPVDLAQILENAIQTVEFSAQAKGIHLNYHKAEPIYTHSDPDRLRQIVWNLLSNAIKFTSEGGQIEIELSVCDHQTRPYAQIRVADTGIGIEPEYLPRIFEYFYQADGGSTRRYGGLGLGLSIVRHLVDLHGGTITAESSGLNQGTTFTVRLPLLTDYAQADRSLSLPSDSPRTMVDSIPAADTEPAAADQPLAPVAAGSATGLSNLTIWIVDDEPDNLELLRFLLSEEGAIITAFTSPVEALQAIAQSPPDLLISDIGMPEMNGYQLIQQVRTLSAQPARSTPAIALTAYAQPADQEQALASGFQAYISKPIDPTGVIETVMQLLFQVPQFWGT